MSGWPRREGAAAGESNERRGAHLREAEQVVVALELLRRGHVLELLHAEVLLGELVLLDRRAHRAVDDHDTLLHLVGEVVLDRLGVLLAGNCDGERAR